MSRTRTGGDQVELVSLQGVAARLDPNAPYGVLYYGAQDYGKDSPGT